jgi:hypothetical protein
MVLKLTILENEISELRKRIVIRKTKEKAGDFAADDVCRKIVTCKINF